MCLGPDSPSLTPGGKSFIFFTCFSRGLGALSSISPSRYFPHSHLSPLLLFLLHSPMLSLPPSFTLRSFIPTFFLPSSPTSSSISLSHSLTSHISSPFPPSLSSTLPLHPYKRNPMERERV